MDYQQKHAFIPTNPTSFLCKPPVLSTPSTSTSSTSPQSPKCPLSMKQKTTPPPPPQTTRRQLLRTTLSLTLLPLSLPLLHPQRTSAAEGIEGFFSRFFFPKQGFNVDDKTMTRDNFSPDRDLLKNDDVKTSLTSLRKLKDDLKQVQKQFENNPSSFDVGNIVKNMVGGVEKLRDDLNKVNQVFNEEDQKKTDRLVRGIIQDVEEVEVVSTMKGGQRTQRKIERTRDWLNKVSGDFEKLLSLYE